MATKSIHHSRPRNQRLPFAPGWRQGKLTIVREVDPYFSPAGWRDRQFACKCDCGEEKIIRSASLRRGAESCGCIRVERHPVKHGHSYKGKNSPTYRVWAGMIRRCEAPNAVGYQWYGGRGIKVCDRWRNSFEAFLSDMGERPDGLTLERNDTNGDYEPGNCRWATMQEQTRNKRNNITHDGVILTDAARALGINHSAISARLLRGWSLERAMTTPRSHKSKSGHVMKGSNHPMSKLTEDQVADIKRRLATGELGIGRALAREYGVTPQLISRIKVGKAWG